MKTKILFLPKYDKQGASSRYRLFQYIPYLEKKGLQITVRPLFSDTYLKRKYKNKLIVGHVLWAYLKRGFYLKFCFLE